MATKRLKNIIQHEVRLLPIGVIFLTFIVFLLLSARGVMTEDLQTFLFPIIALSVFFIPQNPNRRLPLIAFGFAVFLWLGSALEVRGFMPVRSSGHGVFLANLEHDNERYYSRERLRLYNITAKTYDLPQMTMIHRRFSTEDRASSWLDKQRKGLVLLFGGQEWTSGVFKTEGWQYLVRPIENLEGRIPSNKIARDIKKLGINLQNDTYVLFERSLGVPLFLQITPETFSLPSVPISLFNRFLAWLSGGLREKLFGFRQTSEEIASRRDYLNEAANVIGPWKSAAPRGMGKFFVASDDTVNSLTGGEKLIECALDGFAKGAAFATEQEAPEINAAVFNNAGVAMMLKATEREHFAKASEWFWRAAQVVNAEGQPVLGAKLAMLNVIVLDRMGLLDY